MSENLINNMLKISGLPFWAKENIVARSGGNPFFIEEVVLSFIDNGIIVRKNTGFEVTDKIDTTIIPQNINDVLLARIDRLEEKTKELVKTASVIGRSFFYRVLIEVVRKFKDVDKRLEYLVEIQLIKDRIRMEELEYIFKHALTQEAAYGSLLAQNRKELHLIVANSIEAVFIDKLSDFYGMLSYHYNKGEDLVKAEEYMIKAGEVALRSSASFEALDYYQEALKLYLKKCRNDTDPEKLTMFEKNIALAYFYKGYDEKAIEYFDKVLERYNLSPLKNNFLNGIKVFYDLIIISLNLYLPLKKKKISPGKRENEVLDLCYKKAISLANVDPMRNFFEQMATVKRSFGFDLKKVENGVIFPASGSGVLAYAGILPKLRYKLLDYAEKIMNPNNPKELMEYQLYYNMSYIWNGNWNNYKEYNESLLDKNLKIGEIWHAIIYLYHFIMVNYSIGNFNDASYYIRKCQEIGDTYDYPYAYQAYFDMKSILENKACKFHDALNTSTEAINNANKFGFKPFLLVALGAKSFAQIQLNDEQGAGETLSIAKEIAQKQGLVLQYWMESALKVRYVMI